MKRWWLFALSIALAFAIHLNAQTNYVVLRGVISDPQHLAIPHASVKLTSTTNGAERRVTSDDHGAYEVTDCCPESTCWRLKVRGLQPLGVRCNWRSASR